MYVIFPADEIVYLSYGRLIYVPSTPEPENQLRTPPIRASLEESQLFYPNTSETNPYLSQRASTTSSDLGKVVKSSKSSKPKENPKNDIYCIGSRSIDVETRRSSDKIRIDSSTYEPRGTSEQRENQSLSQSEISNTYVVTKHQKLETQESRSLNPKSSFFLKRYADRSHISNQPAESSLSDCATSEFDVLARNTPNRSTNSQQIDISPGAGLNQSGRNQNVHLERSNNLSRFGTTSRSINIRNQPEISGSRRSVSKEFIALNTLGTTSRSLTKSPVETESFGSRTLEAEEITTLNKSRNISKFSRSREVENLGSRTLERGSNCNSNKSSKSSKNSNSSSKSAVVCRPKGSTELKATTRPRTVSDSVSISTEERKKKPTSNSFRSFLRPSALTKDKTPDPPVRPERKKDKKTVHGSDSDNRRLSYSDYVALNRERVPRSDIINTRSDRLEEVREKPVVKREKSPVIKFFRAQSSSPKTFGRDRTAFDFDGFFKQEPPSPGKLSANSIPLKAPPKSVPLKSSFGSDTNIASHQSGEAE